MTDLSFIEALLAPKPKTKSSTGYALVRTGTGVDKVPLDSVRIPGFDSKLGTAKRSRKGRTYRAANGYARPDYVQPELIAYKP
jgi:hypothetical protein